MLWLTTFDTIVLLALHLEASEAVMLAILAPMLPLAYPVAHLAVARARRGEVAAGSCQVPARTAMRTTAGASQMPPLPGE